MNEINNMLLKKMTDNISITSGNEVKAQPETISYVQKMVSGRVKAEKAIVKQILEEIVVRENISKDIHSKIDLDMLQCENFLHEINSITKRQYLIDKDSLRFSARKTEFDMKLLSLEAEKRAEQLSIWNDISTLRRYLLFAFKDYWNAVRREEIINLKDEIEFQ